jgi:GNAT superfamily N-acetyltransferase
MMNIEYRKMKRHEISEIVNIDRSDYADMMYQINDGDLLLVNSIFNHPGLKEHNYEPYIKDLQKVFDDGGVLFGAFYRDVLKGISCVDKQLAGKNKNMVNLSLLWVSKEFRRNGIAKKLLELCKIEGEKRNVDKLYISATPSKNTVDFYLTMGCRKTEEIDPEMYKNEPEDIHLELKL